VVDWGDVPTWVGSITTSATLAVTLYIVQTDRGRAERQQARQVRIWDSPHVEGGDGVRPFRVSTRLHIRNNSNAAVTDVMIGIEGVVVEEGFLASIGTRGWWSILDPGQEAKTEPLDLQPRDSHDDGSPDAEVAQPALYVLFTDVEGRLWVYEVATGRLRRRRAPYQRTNWIMRRWPRRRRLLGSRPLERWGRKGRPD
jgi:hypothetical protein